MTFPEGQLTLSIPSPVNSFWASNTNLHPFVVIEAAAPRKVSQLLNVGTNDKWLVDVPTSSPLSAESAVHSIAVPPPDGAIFCIALELTERPVWGASDLKNAAAVDTSTTLITKNVVDAPIKTLRMRVIRLSSWNASNGTVRLTAIEAGGASACSEPCLEALPSRDAEVDPGQKTCIPGIRWRHSREKTRA
jgi:hypothetical protein